MQQDMQEKFFIALKDLTENNKFLYIEREQQVAQQAQAITPMVELKGYLRLIEAIPLLETDFFRSPIPEEERKEIIYECPKFLGMKYTPPPLNEAATSSVRKNKAALYGIQMALANLSKQVQEKMYGEYKEIMLQTKSTGVQDQDVEVQYNTISINYSSGNYDKLTNYEFKSLIRQIGISDERSGNYQSWKNNTKKLGKLYWKGTSNFGCSPPWSSNAKETFGIDKQLI
ncbi:hypothetical protein BB561_006809 [Smittium simulii]|uniref:Uncharacterized protein n=1 Tax=Smittium simulii TaxID=133385 RepID=A0A2T9Y1B3_9FUNG|nr:hypothetical protein BB561_006809 [Smittium simulii]